MKSVRLVAFACAAGLWASGAGAGYVASQSRDGALQSAVRDVAARGCHVEIRDWWVFFGAHGGSAEDANWHLARMLVEKEFARTNAGQQTFRLNGVLGC